MSAADPMAALKIRFRARLAEERVLLRDAAEAGDAAALRSICHRIAGAGGMFGYAELSALACRVEEEIDAGAEGPALAASTARLTGLIDEVLT
ncbi:MAG TPA: Hpt domain-containing protein [Allosphingosinicella sp.]|jgi:HPt (histidine-containing phosphotransfer) domain-containing protein